MEETSDLTNGQVKLGFSKDGILVSILLLDLTDKEYADLKDSFKLYWIFFFVKSITYL